jgi:murein DD-endopeptidase MepM/ murein hydrolase activator NlpD
MARTRFRIRTLAITAALAAVVPAVTGQAAQRQETADWEGGTVPVATLVPSASVDRGPFLPLIGRPDYGAADAGFGAARSGHVHAGQDMFGPAGTPLVAVADGVVADAGTDGSQGNYVYLYDRRRERTYVYMHMIEPATVKAGERVRAGERLGGLGCTGSCWGDHLHFEVRDGRGIGGRPRDPMPLLRGWESLRRPR